MNSFVYCWTNLTNKKMYIGYHKGTIDDGYICSSKSKEFWEDFNNETFSWDRQIIANGTMEDCVILEYKIIKYFFDNNIPMYNKNISGFIIWDDELKAKASNSHKGKKFSLEHRKNISNSLKGKPGVFRGRKHSEETIMKMKSIKRTETHKKAISDALKGRESPTKGLKQKTEICPYCNKNIPINVFNRWHNENCKENKNE